MHMYNMTHDAYETRVGEQSVSVWLYQHVFISIITSTPSNV